MSSLAAVIFDFDGLILDSETPQFESHRQMYERYGVSLTAGEWCDQIGLWVEGHDQLWCDRLRTLASDAPDLTAYEAETHRIFQELVPPGPMRGIRELLDVLVAAGVPLAIASTAPARWVVAAAERIGVHSCFRTIVTRDDVQRYKPAPDVYLEAARRLGSEPARSVGIEDSAPGIAAARAAGLKTVAIPHWLTEHHDLSGADLRVAHAGELTLQVMQRLINAD